MTRIIFATNNTHKVTEIKDAFEKTKKQYQFLTLKDLNIQADIPEPFNTLEANAEAKVDFIYKYLQSKNNFHNSNLIFAEDSGLFVEALNNQPGVLSARYAGTNANTENNIVKVLSQMAHITKRNAYFKTVICLQATNKKIFFEGLCYGKIIKEKKGNNNFGYDPIFIPKDANRTFAEMNLIEKKQFSHREKAIKKFIIEVKKYF